MAYETAVLKQLEAYTAKHLSRMGGVSPHIRLTDYLMQLTNGRKSHKIYKIMLK
jgi:hypothetical protein